MINEIRLEKFQGPLDLLLQLIEQEELNITEVSLSQITEQYLKYLEKLEGNRSEELADFLVIATKLVYLKSRQLLPYLYPEEEEGPSLEDQLKLYKRYADASKLVEELWNKAEVAYGRVEPPVRQGGFMAPLNAGFDDLRMALNLLLQRIKPISPLPEVSIDQSVTLKEKIQSIFNFLKQWKKFSFRDLFRGGQSKTEVIVGFLAILELAKQGKLTVSQSRAFEEMEIRKV